MKKFLLAVGAVMVLMMVFPAMKSDEDQWRKEFFSCTIEDKYVTFERNGGSDAGYREATVVTSCGNFGVSAYVDGKHNTTGWFAYSELNIGETYDLITDKGSQYASHEWLLRSVEASPLESR